MSHGMAHLVVITIKQCQEARLRSSGAFDATEAQIVPSPLDIAEIPEQFLRSACASVRNSPCKA